MTKPSSENQHLLDAMLLAPNTIKSQLEALQSRLKITQSREAAAAGTDEAVLIRHARIVLGRCQRHLNGLEEELQMLAFIENYIERGLHSDDRPDPTP